jgi:hypothetical protein
MFCRILLTTILHLSRGARINEEMDRTFIILALDRCVALDLLPSQCFQAIDDQGGE